MINGFELTEELIRFEKKAVDWKDAIIMSSQGLLDSGFIKQSYIDAMIAAVIEHGPYMVIAPNIALPHARPDTGSIEIGYSVLKLEEPVHFSEDSSEDASFFVTLSCVDAISHLEILEQIVMILSDEEKNELIFKANTKEELLNIFND